MGKKQTLNGFNPDDFEVVDSANEFELVSAPKEAPKPTVKTQSTDEIIGAIEGISEGEKAIIKGLADKRVDNETLSNSILTLQGKHPKQAGHKGYYIKDGVPVPLAKFQVPKDEKLAASVFSEKDLPQELSDSFDRGLIRLGKGIAKAPEFLVDLGLEATWNKTMRDIGRKDLEYTAKEFGADTETIGKYMNIPLKESVDVMNKSLEKRDEDYQKVYQKGVVDYFNQGDYAKAGSVLANSIVESAPTTIALAMTGGGTGMVLGGGAVFGAQKLDELEKSNPDLTKEEKLGVATANGLLEGIFEQWGITKIGAIAKDIIKKEGKDVAAKYIEDVVRGAYEPAMKKYFGAVAEESLGEMATQISQNAVDKFSGVNPDLDLMDGVLDAGIIGLGASVGPSVLTSAAEKDKVTKSNEQSKFIYDRVKKGPEEVNAFKAEIENAASNGLLTGEEAEKAKFQADVYSQYYEQTKDMDLGDEQKRKIYDLSYQKQGLETELKGINKDELNPIELGKYNAKAKQAKDIQSDIDNLMLGAEVKKETVAGEKTISDLSKPEKKEEEKVELSPELQAINDRYKEETGFLPEKEVQRRLKEKEPLKMTEVKPTQFNEKRYNHREKFKQVAEHIDSTPEGRESGSLKVVDFTDPSGKKGKRIEVELPTGHRIWMSSSMAREGSDIMGHFREEHLPKNTSGKRAYEMMEDFPVKMKLVTTREGATGDNTAIKVYNAKTGKIIGWAKATTKGEDILTQPIISADEKFKGKPGVTKAQYDAEVKRREDLAREEMIDRVEPVDGEDVGGQLTTTPVTPKGPVKPPKQTTPKTKGEFVSSQIEKLKSEGDYDPSLQDFYEGHFGKQFDVANVVPEKTEKPKKGPEQSKAQKLYYKIRSKVRDNFEKYISGKKADSPEETGANSQEEYNDIVLRDSEVPAELAEAYLSAKNESVDNTEGTIEYAIYEFFANPKNTISEAHFAKYGDPNFANRKDLPAIRTYVSKDGAKIDQVAQEMSTNIGQEVQVQDIIDFILNNPTGIKDYENSMKVSQKRALAKKFRAITGETLNDVTAKAIVDEIYGEPVREMDKITDEEAQAELEARKKAQEENPDELLQKEKGAKNNKEAIQKVIDVLKKSMPKVKVAVDENLTDKDGNPVAGKWDPKTNTISVNPNYADIDTPIHEYGHVLIDAIGRDNKVIKAAIKQLEGTKLWKETKQRYPDLNESNLGVEVLAEAIGREGQGIFDTVAEQSRFKTFLDYIFDWLKTKLGLNKNIAKSLAKQIITGRGTKEMEGFSKEDEFQIVGEKAKLKKQVLEDRRTAEMMEAFGKSPEEIRIATGWEKGVDERWRYEIGDESAKIKNIDLIIQKLNEAVRGPKDITYYLGNLSDVLSYKELYRLYPELRNIKVEIYHGRENVKARYNGNTQTVQINARAYSEGREALGSGELFELITHEVQHLIQSIEGFAGGANNTIANDFLKKKYYKKAQEKFEEWSKDGTPITFEDVLIDVIYAGEAKYADEPYDQILHRVYEKIAVEVEARNVALRTGLTDEQKKKVPLELTEDVDRAVQIILENRGESESLQRPKYKRAEGQEVMSLNDFRETELNRDVEKEKDDINYVNEIIKDKSSTDKERKNAEGLKNTILSRIREDKKKYVDYLDQVRGFEESMDKIVEDDGLEDFTLDELLDIYHNSHYSMDNDSPLNKAVKLRIATYLTKEQIKKLEKNPLWEQKKGAVNKKDLSGIQLFFKSLADIPEYLPGVQVLGKELNRAALEKMKEIRERGEKLTKLAKAVIKEKNGMLGMLHPKGLFSSDSAKYFEYLDNGKGQLITKEEGKKLGITDAQMAYRDYMQELVDLRNATYDENDEIISNDLMKRDKGFMEAWRTEGFLPALAYYLGRGINDDLLVNVRNEQGGYDQKEFSDAQSEILSKTNTFSDKLKAGIKIAKLSYQGKKNKTDAPYMNYKGGLTMKYDKPRPKDKGYSKDFFASGLDLINDYAHVKHMGPLVPLFDSILYLHEKGFDSKLPNVKKFIESEMNDKLYQKQKGFEPTVDATLRFLRRLGSLTTMAFNIPANTVNIFIGNYNNWRQEGLPHILKGNARLFSSDGKISDKGLDVLKQFDVVKFDAESNPQINGAKLFDKLAYFFNKIGEYQIQGSMFLGHMTNEEWDSFEKNESGDWVLKPGVDKKAFTDKMMSYRDAVSSIQGKYDEKDRRMFMRGEIGKSVAQFKTWMPDWFKSRFGKEFINKYGVTERGSLNMFTKEAIAELKKDFSGNPFNKNGTFKNKQAARNLRGAITIAALYVATHSGDDDDKKKKKQYYETLSLDNALGNILFIIDPSQMKYLIENPVAVKGTITKFIDALDGVLHGDVKKAKKNAKKLIPYNKLVDQVDMLTGNNKKK